MSKEKFNHMLAKKEVELVQSDTITVREQREILNKIEKRMTYIIAYICKEAKWWDYSGGVSYADEAKGNFLESIVGTPEKEISIRGDYSVRGYSEVNCEFSLIPLKWLYENFEEEFEKEIKKILEDAEKEKEKIKKEFSVTEKKLNSLKRALGSLSQEDILNIAKLGIDQVKKFLKDK